MKFNLFIVLFMSTILASGQVKLISDFHEIKAIVNGSYSSITDMAYGINIFEFKDDFRILKHTDQDGIMRVYEPIQDIVDHSGGKHDVHIRLKEISSGEIVHFFQYIESVNPFISLTKENSNFTPSNYMRVYYDPVIVDSD